MTPRPLVPRCPGQHDLGQTFSRSTLILNRNWRPSDVVGLLGDAETPAPHQEFPREVIAQGRDRFCLSRVLLAEIADVSLNRHLEPQLQNARDLVIRGRGVHLRSGAGEWRTLMRSDIAKEGAEIEVACPALGKSTRRTVATVGLIWDDIALVTLTPTPLEEKAGMRSRPSLQRAQGERATSLAL